jgi:hypothetical protein
LKKHRLSCAQCLPPCFERARLQLRHVDAYKTNTGFIP